MLFGAFSKMIGSLPAPAILKSLDLEGKMLEEDLKLHRFALHDEGFSILGFCQFVRMVKAGEVSRFLQSLPPDHREFYKETIVRLIHAGELPPLAMERFEYAFPLIS